MADAESFEPRASDLALIASAALGVRVGLGYDHWLDKLLDRRVQTLSKAPGPVVDASSGIPLLEVVGRNPFAQDNHGHGIANPHYWLDPANAEMMTAVIVEALARADPANGAAYAARRSRFLEELKRRMASWEQALAPVRGKPLIAYHNTWAYFARRFRVNFAGFIEPRPGVPPSASQLGTLIALAKEKSVAAIVRQPHEPARNVDFLAAKTGARVVILASSVGAVPAARDYIALIDYNVNALAAALR
jgi:ABC-type Zn uptake system ZnuABC Zn-binding protein ZnuA